MDKKDSQKNEMLQIFLLSNNLFLVHIDIETFVL